MAAFLRTLVREREREIGSGQVAAFLRTLVREREREIGSGQVAALLRTLFGGGGFEDVFGDPATLPDLRQRESE